MTFIQFNFKLPRRRIWNDVTNDSEIYDQKIIHITTWIELDLDMCLLEFNLCGCDVCPKSDFALSVP